MHVRPTGGNGMTAMLQAHRERTDEHGRCTFDRLGAGNYRVEANARGRTSDRRQIDVELQNEPYRTRLVLGEGGVVTGTVLTPDGKPLAGAHGLLGMNQLRLGEIEAGRASEPTPRAWVPSDDD